MTLSIVTIVYLRSGDQKNRILVEYLMTHGVLSFEHILDTQVIEQLRLFSRQINTVRYLTESRCSVNYARKNMGLFHLKYRILLWTHIASNEFLVDLICMPKIVTEKNMFYSVFICLNQKKSKTFH